MDLLKDIKKYVDISMKGALNERECAYIRIQHAMNGINEIFYILNYDSTLDNEEIGKYRNMQNDLVVIKNYLLICIEKGIN